MIVTAWNNGSPSKTGAGYGLKLKASDRDQDFKKEWQYIILALDGFSDTIQVNVAKKSFWGDTCRELIHAEIGHWLLQNGLAPWPKGKPPRLKLTHIQSNHFRLTKQ
jgi:hypothetical protein